MTSFSGLQGTLHLPSDPGFLAATTMFNRRYADRHPQAAISVSTPEQVSTAITWSRDNGIPVVARGGGHSYAGHSTTDGLVIDLRGVNQIKVDPDSGLVTVGGGARTGDLYAELRRHDLALPLGNADDVGIGGLTLGGGVAAVSRAFGLTCDALVSTELVLADGSVVTCDDVTNPDLFWACRGAGGGNFGVNTSFTFQARPTRPSSTCLLLWDWQFAVEVVVRMQEVMRDAPDEFAARIGVSRAQGTGVVSVVGWHLGSADELADLLAPAVAVARPTRSVIADRTYWEAKDYLHHNTVGDAFAVRTRTTPVPLSPEGVATMVAAVDKWPGSGNPDGAGAALFTWGGAINRVPVAETAFAHRDVLFLLSMDTSWASDDPPEVVRDNLAWLTALHEDMGAFARDASYVNFPDPDLPDWRAAYHGPNHARLVEVKRRHDPDRVFSFAQAI